MTPAHRAFGRRGCGRFAGRRSRRSPGRGCALGAGHRLLRWWRGLRAPATDDDVTERRLQVAFERSEDGAHRAAGDPREGRSAPRAPFERRRQARREAVAGEAVASRRRCAEYQVRPARAVHVVVADLVALREPDALVGGGEEGDAEGLVVLDEVLRDQVLAPPVHHDADPVRRVLQVERRGADVVVVVHPVAGDQGVALRRELLGVEGVRTMPARLPRHSEFTTNRSPPAFVPE